MANDIGIGDQVKLTGVPDWLLHDLPEDEQQEILSYIGQLAIVQEIDAYGYFWIGFGNTIASMAEAHYSGHSFAVAREFIEPA
jgi:hypothetical protein